MRKQPIFFSLLLNLNDFEGHGYVYHLDVQKATSSLGLNFYFLLPIECSLPTLPKQWIKTFCNTRHFFLFPFLRLWDFMKMFRNILSSPRIFFIDSLETKDFILLTFSALFFMPKTDQLWLIFRYNLELLRYQGKIHGILCWLLKKKLKKNLVLLTDSELISSSLQKKWNVVVNVMPIPHGKCPQPQQKVHSTKKMQCWWPGKPREVKGLRDIQRLFSIDDPQGGQCELIVHEDTALPLTSNSLACNRISGNLPREEYEKWLVQSDVILLPYDPVIYQESTSGIFVEAVCAGKIPLVKEGSWLAYELKKFGLETLIVDWENPLFFSHLVSLTKNSSLKEKLLKMQDAYQRYHCVENFSKRMGELLDLV